MSLGITDKRAMLHCSATQSLADVKQQQATNVLFLLRKFHSVSDAMPTRGEPRVQCDSTCLSNNNTIVDESSVTRRCRDFHVHHSRSRSWPPLTAYHDKCQSHRAVVGERLVRVTTMLDDQQSNDFNVQRVDTGNETRSPSPPSLIEHESKENRCDGNDSDAHFVDLIISMLDTCCESNAKNESDTTIVEEDRTYPIVELYDIELGHDDEQIGEQAIMIELSTDTLDTGTLVTMCSVADPRYSVDDSGRLTRLYLTPSEMHQFELRCLRRLHAVTLKLTRHLPATIGQIVCFYYAHQRRFAAFLPHIPLVFIKHSLRQRRDLFIIHVEAGQEYNKCAQYYRAVPGIRI